jgi:photosystem II stability/assembly factor-like uncharacterized protein
MEMPHIHGLGFSADGRHLIVPAHDGFRIYADGAWQTPALPAHDYMGYAPTSEGFYSSGHPDPSSQLVNPLGLVKSTDGGKTLEWLGFQGESDFHLMGVGYYSHVIYVVNPTPNSTLQVGLFYSLDDGKQWQPSAARGLTAPPTHIAVHPHEATTIALATGDGLFVSTDYGASFERAGPATPVTAVSFSPDGEWLLFGSSMLSSYALASKQIRPMQSPPLAARDLIVYVAINPVRSQEIAVASTGRDIFRSTDGGQSWEQIAQSGRGRERLE